MIAALGAFSFLGYWPAFRNGFISDDYVILRRDADVFLGIAWMALSLLPYLFLACQNHVPSRQEHLAAMGLAMALAFIVEDFRGTFLRIPIILLFIIGNLGYL